MTEVIAEYTMWCPECGVEKTFNDEGAAYTAALEHDGECPGGPE